ncbi:hypothetical protein HBI56_196950 [Parastagonospora nodorum]|uniref:Uncharacterized protein n=1 Tax=Phaeosphaeria nodorum (strain SN15 / ATCC MYA-4574 / FGSC 10173) TaxID=321614 RepID=A0A7U2F6J3_PHANO|nr:hypothetical protein HBH56_208910 [Parastagonospora nodorum]QRC99655.1 hypothetical protein JI435_413780 [Parastagonospora nodorum SN15]KAH3923555.1 hypothetical protein HBH54_207780 [Parastagonospora nodorum]KAH3941537.1 hypothetical protein HBH53_199040 [Parastagonospora nodorum]KAH3960493.1 hypothetical protein HBH51_192300 [Parastagonospora nodorum]
MIKLSPRLQHCNRLTRRLTKAVSSKLARLFFSTRSREAVPPRPMSQGKVCHLLFGRVSRRPI